MNFSFPPSVEEAVLGKRVKRRSRNVHWKDVQIRSYPCVVTDNPAVQNGPAIGIGWDYHEDGCFSLDTWEDRRQPHRMEGNALVLNRQQRENRLKQAGIHSKEIAAMVRSILKAKNQRKQTVTNLNVSGLEESVETAKRRLGKLIKGQIRRKDKDFDEQVIIIRDHRRPQ